MLYMGVTYRYMGISYSLRVDKETLIFLFIYLDMGYHLI